jgi:hypothetical protein
MAVLWERHGWAGPVARYVEMTLEFEDDPRAASGTLLAELRQAEQLLGMTTVGLLKARASIDAVAVGAGEAGAAGGQVIDLSTRAAG